jgi:Domain of unknown function (DU1801)
MRSAAPTVTAYLAALSPERREILSEVRRIILANLPKGYVEVMNWGMIAYEVPLAINPKTYNGKPLMYAALASQKNHMAIYLCSIYCMPGALTAFKASWKVKKLDMGAACVRFKKLADLDLEAIARVLVSTPMSEFIAASTR